MDMMDSDLPCLCPPVLLPNAPLGSTGDFRSPGVEGVCSESAGPCPRTFDGGLWAVVYDEFRETVGLVVEE
jgi:hypothetical protein